MSKSKTKNKSSTADSGKGTKADKDKGHGGTSPPDFAEQNGTPPVSSKWSGYLRVGSVIRESPNVKTIRLLPSNGEPYLPFTYIPGQFLNTAFFIGGARMIRSYSISSSPMQREYVELSIRREPRGAVSRHIVDLLKPGDLVEAGGPVGRFTFDGTEADSIVLISAGVGVTPMLSITRYLTENSWKGEIYYIFACKVPADYLFAEELARLQEQNSKLHVAVTISQPEGTNWTGHRGRISKELLTETVPDLVSRRVHICGPPGMMDATKTLLAELGVPAEQVKTEAFGTPKPKPAAAGTTAKVSTPASGPLVKFSKSNKSGKTRLDMSNGDSPPEQTILELSEELGVGVDFSCRVGTCGVCKVKLLTGEVEQEVQDSLDEGDKANGIILACQAKPKTEVTVEA